MLLVFCVESCHWSIRPTLWVVNLANHWYTNQNQKANQLKITSCGTPTCRNSVSYFCSDALRVNTYYKYLPHFRLLVVLFTVTKVGFAELRAHRSISDSYDNISIIIPTCHMSCYPARNLQPVSRISIENLVQFHNIFTTLLQYKNVKCFMIAFRFRCRKP